MYYRPSTGARQPILYLDLSIFFIALIEFVINFWQKYRIMNWQDRNLPRERYFQINPLFTDVYITLSVTLQHREVRKRRFESWKNELPSWNIRVINFSLSHNFHGDLWIRFLPMRARRARAVAAAGVFKIVSECRNGSWGKFSVRIMEYRRHPVTLIYKSHGELVSDNATCRHNINDGNDVPRARPA